MGDPAFTAIPAIAPILPIGGVAVLTPILMPIPRVAFGVVSQLEFRLDSLPPSVQQLFKKGSPSWPQALDEAIRQGVMDQPKLADLIFFMHHPERMRPDGVGPPMNTQEPNFIKLQAEWDQYHTIVQGRLNSSFVPPVFIPEQRSDKYEEFVAARTTGRITLMINGRNRPKSGTPDEQSDTFKSMRAAVESLGPNDTIYLVTWEFKPLIVPLDKTTTKTWAELFREKAEQGVRIRIIVSVHPVDVFMSDLKALDGVIRSLPPNKVDNLKYIGSRHQAQIGIPGLLSQPVGDHHQKFMIVKKGKTTIAFCGGLDITEGRTPPHWTTNKVWHDIHSKLEGLIVKDLEREFVLRWNREKDAAKTAAIGKWEAKDIVGIWTKGFETLTLSPVQLVDRERSINTHDLQMHRTVSTGPTLQHTKRDDIWQSYFKIIGQSKRFLFLENQYFHEPRLAAALVTQLQAHPGLIVIVVVATGSDDKVHDYVKHCYTLRFEFFSRLLLSDLTLLNRIGVYTMFYPNGIVHSKLIISDDKVLSMGSANANQRGFFLDTELNVMLDHAEAVRAFRVRLWSHNLGIPEREVAAWNQGDFISQWDTVAKYNTARRSKPETMMGEGIERYYPLSDSDPKSILKLMRKWSLITDDIVC